MFQRHPLGMHKALDMCYPRSRHNSSCDYRGFCWRSWRLKNAKYHSPPEAPCILCLLQQVFHHMPMHVGQAEVPSLVPIG